MTSPTARTLALLRRRGYVAGVVERRVPQANIRRDFLGCVDIVAAHPRERVILAVQATTAAHVSHRLAKSRALPELAAWLKAGGRFEVWGWCKRGKLWEVKIVGLQPEDLAAVVVQKLPRRRPDKHENLDLFIGGDDQDAAAAHPDAATPMPATDRPAVDQSGSVENVGF